MTLTVRVEDAATAEVLDAAEWYEDRRPGLGPAFVDAFERVLSRLDESPAQHPVLHGFEHFRRTRLPRFPYHVIFWINHAEGEVVIVAVAHGRRAPGRWSR